jgi:hypothetical protein
MRRGRPTAERGGMTTTHTTPSTATRVAPPLSRAARIGTGLCLVTAGLTNGLAQYVGELLMPELGDFSAQIRWGAAHPAVHVAEQTALLVSMLALPLGLLGLGALTRWAAPRLTAVGLLLALWGMWGFHNVVALGYAAGVVAPGAIGTDAAVTLNQGYLDHPGTTVTALLPHLVGSFLGLALLALAGLRGRSLPRVPLLLLLVFLVWDFLLPTRGPLEPHLLLAVSLCWVGVHVLRMPQERWRNPGQASARA